MAGFPKVLWGGGSLPLPDNARVIVTYRDGITSKVRVAGGLRWEHTNLNDDIVEYRVVVEGGENG